MGLQRLLDCRVKSANGGTLITASVASSLVTLPAAFDTITEYVAGIAALRVDDDERGAGGTEHVGAVHEPLISWIRNPGGADGKRRRLGGIYGQIGGLTK